MSDADAQEPARSVFGAPGARLATFAALAALLLIRASEPCKLWMPFCFGDLAGTASIGLALAMSTVFVASRSTRQIQVGAAIAYGCVMLLVASGLPFLARWRLSESEFADRLDQAPTAGRARVGLFFGAAERWVAPDARMFDLSGPFGCNGGCAVCESCGILHSERPPPVGSALRVQARLGEDWWLVSVCF